LANKKFVHRDEQNAAIQVALERISYECTGAAGRFGAHGGFGAPWSTLVAGVPGHTALLAVEQGIRIACDPPVERYCLARQYSFLALHPKSTPITRTPTRDPL